MDRIGRKAYYVGTWREDYVTDTTMRQIIARSHAEKGQKVKVKLSKDGLNLSRTVFFQENFLSSFPLSDVYFLTVNPHHPTCLLCIVADPVKKYLILVLRTVTDLEAREMIGTFQRLKNNPTVHAGNVILKRKDNGNWTLRERSQHNANRQLQQIFQEASSQPNSLPPNGHAGGHTPPFFGGTLEGTRSGGGRVRVHSASQTAGEMTEEEMALMKLEVENLSEELRDLKLVLEKAGTVSPRTLSTSSTPRNNSHNNHSEKSHYVTTEVRRAGNGGHSKSNGPLVTAISEGGDYPDYKQGEVRVCVDDHREDEAGRVKSHRTTNPNKPLYGNVGVQRQITVPEPHSFPRAPNGYGTEPVYTVPRHVSKEFVQVPSDVSRKLSSSPSLRSSTGVKIVPASTRHGHDRHHQFRSLRISRNSGVPTTIVKPIEEIYSHGNTFRRRPVVLVQTPVPYAMHEPAQAVYIAQQPSAVYVAQKQAYAARSLTPTGSLRRSGQASGVHTTQGSEGKALHYSGKLDDVLL